MKRLYRWAGVCWFVLFCAAAAPARAAETPDQAGAAKALAAKDSVCTSCHDSTSPKKIFSMYQTRHGNKADERTPGCQNCHGPSDVHIKDPGKPTDVVFTPKSKNISPADTRNESCLKCHDTHGAAATALERKPAPGARRGLHRLPQHPCARPEGAEQGNAGRGLLHVSQGAARSDTPDLDAPARDHGREQHRQDGVLGLPQSARIDRADAARQTDGQRDLLHLPRGKARAVPVGARARRRQLHELPHAARLDQRAAPEVTRAVSLPGLSQRRSRQSGQ